MVNGVIRAASEYAPGGNMRVTRVALFTSVAMGVAALAAAAGGAGTGGLDSSSMSGADIGSTFSGASHANGVDDPDLPIATARYGEEPPPAALMAAQGSDPYRNVAMVQAPTQLAAAPTVS